MRHIAIIKFYFRLCNLGPERYRKLAFLLLSNVVVTGVKTWVSDAKELITFYNISVSDSVPAIKPKVMLHFTSSIVKKLRATSLTKRSYELMRYSKPLLRLKSILILFQILKQEACFAD